MAAQLETRRTMMSTGLFLTPELSLLGQKHPSVFQIDVLFPRSLDLEQTLKDERFHSSYYTGKGTLLDVLNGARDLKRIDSLHALSTSRLLPDVWAISSGTLHLNVAKTTYEGLGVQGSKVHEVFKGKGVEEQYHIAIPLNPSSGEDKTKLARFQKMLETQKQEWEFVFCFDGEVDLPAGHIFSPTSSTKPYPIQPSVHQATNVHAPQFLLSQRPTLKPHPNKKKKLAHSEGAKAADPMDVDDCVEHNTEGPRLEDAIEDWEVKMGELFEWVGMAGLGAQRLQANDRVDPYVVVYTPPAPVDIQEITHMQWKGLMHPVFVQALVDGVTRGLRGSEEHTPSPSASRNRSFVALTLHVAAHSPAPGVKLALKGKAPGISKVPRGPGEGEDCACVILVPEDSVGSDHSIEAIQDVKETKDRGRWAMVESVGRWDTRFG